jgi:hypothetical protein
MSNTTISIIVCFRNSTSSSYRYYKACTISLHNSYHSFTDGTKPTHDHRSINRRELGYQSKEQQHQRKVKKLPSFAVSKLRQAVLEVVWYLRVF